MSKVELHWSIDSMVIRDTTVFSYGWIFNESKKIKQLSLNQADNDGLISSIKIDYGKNREDVGSYFSEYENAAFSGYIVYGSFCSSTRVQGLKLLCTYEDGSSESIDIPENCLFNPANEKDDNITHKRVILKQALVLIKRGMMLLKGGNFSLLYDKIKRFKNNEPSKKIINAGDISKILTPTQRKKVIFFLDHDLGGGANHYRNQLIQEKIADGYSAIVLAFNISSLSYKLIVKTLSGDSAFKIPNKEFILDLINFVSIKEIIYNTGVSFVGAESLPGFLLDLKLKTKAKLVTLAHDFFPICPSHFLINDKGKYCDIPDPQVCRACLKNNTFGFTTLFESGDINEWRDQWGGLIIASDRFITFSQNTLNLYRRAYPQIREENTVIAPHSVNYLPRKAKINQDPMLRIGVVGQIGYHKGSEFVKELAQEIKNTGCNAEIIIIGAIESSCPSDIVTQTGKYKQSELPDLLESNRVNVILFPSIWPETFSYVVQEMIELNYPVACFNLGAPAERLKDYQKGLVLSSILASSVLQELIKFHRKFYAIQ